MSASQYPGLVFAVIAHELFDGFGVAGEAFRENDAAGGGDEDHVFDADADAFGGEVDAGFDSDDHAGLEGRVGGAGVVDF